jgi:hypothetical protein
MDPKLPGGALLPGSFFLRASAQYKEFHVNTTRDKTPWALRFQNESRIQ